MTQMLEKALSEIAKLGEREQNALASNLLAEMESERRWVTSFAGSQDALSGLADKALPSTTPAGLARSDPVVRSVTTESFRARFASAPESVQKKIRAAYDLWS